MTLQQLNTADYAEALAALLLCCGSNKWGEEMLSRRPFQNREALLSAAESVWNALEPADWLQAFSAHPKIGAKKLADWCSQEQSGLASTPEPLLERLRSGNETYEKRFGWIFLVNASGKSGSEMLALLETRLQNDSDEELGIAAGEQAKITGLRLQRLLEA